MKNLAFVILIFVSLSSFGNDSNYVFGWTQLNDPDLKKPRGGTTIGEKVTLDKNPNDLDLLDNSEFIDYIGDILLELLEEKLKDGTAITN